MNAREYFDTHSPVDAVDYPIGMRHRARATHTLVSRMPRVFPIRVSGVRPKQNNSDKATCQCDNNLLVSCLLIVLPIFCAVNIRFDVAFPFPRDA